MRVHPFFLLILAALVASTAAQSTADSTGRSLRVAVTFGEVDNSEERAPNLSLLKSAVSKTITSAATSMKIKMWGTSGKNVDELKKLLGLQNFDDAALEASPQFKVYDELLTAQVSRWSKKDMTLEQVRVTLGIDGLSGFAFTNNPNLKYYQQFVERQIPTWAKKDESLTTVWTNLGLNKLRRKADIGNNPNYHLYFSFINKNFENYAVNALTEAEVKAKMRIIKMTGMEKHINTSMLERFNTMFDTYRLEGWFINGVSGYDVWANLNVGAIRPGERASSPNFQIYRSYAAQLDDKAEKNRLVKSPVANAIGRKVTGAEINSIINIWVDTGRSDVFVKYSLGLNGLRGNELTKKRNYKYFKTFLDYRDQVMGQRELNVALDDARTEAILLRLDKQLNKSSSVSRRATEQYSDGNLMPHEYIASGS